MLHTINTFRLLPCCIDPVVGGSEWCACLNKGSFTETVLCNSTEVIQTTGEVVFYRIDNCNNLHFNQSRVNNCDIIQDKHGYSYNDLSRVIKSSCDNRDHCNSSEVSSYCRAQKHIPHDMCSPNEYVMKFNFNCVQRPTTTTAITVSTVTTSPSNRDPLANGERGKAEGGLDGSLTTRVPLIVGMHVYYLEATNCNVSLSTVANHVTSVLNEYSFASMQDIAAECQSTVDTGFASQRQSRNVL